MSLPQIAVPEDTIKLLSQKQPIRYRPYLVGEEKIMLMAQAAHEQNPDGKDIEKAVKQIIKRCTFDGLNPDTLPSFDTEYLFLQLRAHSVSNIIESQFRCKKKITVERADVPEVTTADVPEVTTKECNTFVSVNINIDDIKLIVPEGHTNKVMLSSDIGVVLKYPSSDTHDEILKNPNDLTGALMSCIEAIYTAGGDYYEAKDQTKDELQTFVDRLSLTNILKVKESFFDSMPRLEYKFEFKCPKCGYTEEVTLRGLTDFFD